MPVKECKVLIEALDAAKDLRAKERIPVDELRKKIERYLRNFNLLRCKCCIETYARIIATMVEESYTC